VTDTPALVFLTGASGLLGGSLAARLARTRVPVCALLHARGPRATRWPDTVRFVTGDIRQPRLGLGAPLYRELAGRVTDVLHCAGRTDFSLPRAEAERANVLGTRNLLEFARSCPRLRKIGVLSTAYVAGQRTGDVLEGELDHDAGFVNPYEASKYRMERLLRRAGEGLPISVYRLSTVIGSARTGRVERLNAVHHALRLYHRGLVPMVPGDAGSPVDLISSEYAVGAIFHLFARRFRPGTTYHIVAGPHHAPPLREFLDWTVRCFARFDPGWQRRAVSMPPIVALGTFRRLDETVAQAGDSLLRSIMRVMASFAPQLAFPKRFDAANTVRALRGTGIRPAPLATYYPRIVRWCLATRWAAATR
jgi:nucleoside-diphosphate-sugar epimerase